MGEPGWQRIESERFVGWFYSDGLPAEEVTARLASPLTSEAVRAVFEDVTGERPFDIVSPSERAEAIVRDLATREPVVDGRDPSDALCTICTANADDHYEWCCWRRAREWVTENPLKDAT